MPRLVFSNVPTASGGVISGNISIGAGSPFGSGGKYEAQVAEIQARIAEAPEGYYDPRGHEAFMRKDELLLEIEHRYYKADDQEVIAKLLTIPQVVNAFAELKRMPQLTARHSQAQRRAQSQRRQNYSAEITLHTKRILADLNAPLIKEYEEQKRQQEIDQAVQIALEQAKKKAQELEMVRPPKVSVFVEPPPEEITVAPPDYVKPEKPPRVSVFVEPPPQTVTVSPPGYVQPEKPPRIDVHDPSTESAFDPFGGLLEGVFGPPTEVITADVELPIEPEPEVITADVELPIEPELEVTTADIELPIEPEPEVTTADIEPPLEQIGKVFGPYPEEEIAPTEERPVKWIPEPFFSFINEVFRR